MTLVVCGYHHRNFDQTGWSCVMTNGIPHWIPPATLDPEQRPRRHRRFDRAQAVA
jgi:hypothetical protein